MEFLLLYLKQPLTETIEHTIVSHVTITVLLTINSFFLEAEECERKVGLAISD